MLNIFESLATTKSATVTQRTTSTVLGVFCKYGLTGVAKSASGRLHVIGPSAGTPPTATYATSDDEGATWTFRTPILASLSWSAICNDGNTIFIASDNGLVAKSVDDGVTWVTVTNATAGATATPKLKFQNGILFCLMDLAIKYSSDNGATWTLSSFFSTSVSPSSTTKGRAFAYNGTTLAVFCSNSAGTNRLVTSTDMGVTWTVNSFNPGGRTYNDIAYNGSTWVVVGDVGNIASTNNLINWTARLNQDSVFKSPSANSNFQCVIWDGTNWIVSSDANWTAVLDAGPTTKANWQMLPNNRRDTANGLTQMIYVNGTIYASAPFGVLLKSTDHINWTNLTTSTGIQPVSSLAYNGRRWVGITKNIWSSYDPLDFGRIVVSAENDNQSWSKIAYESSDNIDFNYVVHGAAGFVAVNGAGRAAKSVDGINWVESETGTTESLLKIIYDGTRYIAISANNICTTTDGVTWTLSTIPNKVGNQVSIAYGDYKYMIITNGSKSYYSTDRVNWIEGSTSSGLKDLSTNGHIWLAVGGAGGITNRSYDGVTWGNGGNTGIYSCDKIYFIDDGFIAGFSGITYKSLDGTSWTQFGLVNYGLYGVNCIGYSRDGDGPVKLVVGTGYGNIAVVRTNPLKF